MPTHFNSDETPIVQFDSQLEISPFALFRRFRNGRPPLLFDTRAKPGRWTLDGAQPYAGEEWAPDADQDVVLFDEDGTESLPHVLRYQNTGYTRVKMLFGGLELYEFSLDPQVVGEETFLIPAT